MDLDILGFIDHNITVNIIENGEIISKKPLTLPKKMVKGVMIESYIEEGNQKICDHMTYGKSITDPCLGWKDTEKLIYKIAEEC